MMKYEEGRGPRVLGSKGPKVPVSQVTFKYKFDSKDSPSCFTF